MTSFRCTGCLRTTESDHLSPVCPRCGSALIVDDPPLALGRRGLDETAAGVWRYGGFLPHLAKETVVSLGEGGTPLLGARRLGAEAGLRGLIIKDESRNPTGSFIDRGATVLVSLAKMAGFTECNCTTTGNLGASLSAYCARAGIRARIAISPSTDRGKLYQMLAYGAEVDTVPAPGKEASEGRTLKVTAANPYLLEGEKTTGFEIAEDLGWVLPDVIMVPVGTGGHLSMIWRAVTQMTEQGLLSGPPCRLVGVQLRASANRRSGESGNSRGSLEGGMSTELEESEPFFINEVERAIRESRGGKVAVTLPEAVGATGTLARTEGIFAEPASASVVAAIGPAVNSGLVGADEKVVCVITAAGLKDTKSVSKLAKAARRVPVRGDSPFTLARVGETKLEILDALSVGQTYGYKVWRLLNVSKRMSTASVYQHLAELEALGLVHRGVPVIAGGRERVPYQLTRKGIDYLNASARLGRG